MNYFDFFQTEGGLRYELIPAHTLAKMRMNIKPGGYDDPSRGWHGGFATRSKTGESVFLSCAFTILEGPYAKRKLWSNIGLYSPKNDNSWGKIGRHFIRSMLQSAHGIAPNDQSEQAKSKLKIEDFGDLESLIFVGRITIGKDGHDQACNEVKTIITPEHPQYQKLMGAQPINTSTQTATTTWGRS